MRNILIAFMVAGTYSVQDVKSEGCRALCVRDGYTSGKAVGQKLEICECVDHKPYDKLLKRSLHLGPPDRPPMTEEDKKLGMVAPFVPKSSFYEDREEEPRGSFFFD